MGNGSSFSIRTKVIILLLVMALVPFGLITYAGMMQRQHDVRSAELFVGQLCDEVSNHQNVLLTGAEQLLSSFGLLPAVEKRDAKATSAIFRNLIGKSPQITNILMIDSAGAVWASALPMGSTLRANDRRFFRNAMATGRFSSGEYTIGSVLNKPAFSFGYPLKNRDGRTTDIAVAAFTLTHYNEILKTKKIPEGTTLTLIDHQGTILFDSTAPGTFGHKDRDELFQRMDRGPDHATFSVDKSGTGRLFAYRKLRLAGEPTPYMYVRSGIPMETVVKASRKTLTFSLGTMISITLVALGFVTVVTKRSIIDKIVALREATQKIARGNLNVRVTDRVSGGELGELGQAFDEMARRLADDITERRQAEEERTNALAFVESLLAASPTGIVVYDGTTGQCVMANQAVADMVGGTVEELQAQNFRMLTLWKDAGIDQLAETVLSDGITRQMEKTFSTTFGKKVAFLCYLSRFEANGVPHLMFIASDVSEKKRLEEEKGLMEAQMLHVQKLESLGVLAGGIAHDFNNILMAILGNADLALMRLPLESPARENILQIENASRRAADLARQMLAYSGKGRFVIEDLSLTSVVEEMSHMLDVSISKKVVLRYNITRDIPAVKADATQLRQVIMNLVINASEAIGDKSGTIAISTGAMHCDRQYLQESWIDDRLAEGTYVYLEIADTGCGMDRDIIPKIFDPFFTTKFTGRGLGMAAILGIVRGHKGAIKVHSEKGKGTTFKLLLPASTPAAGHAGAPPLPDLWQGTGTILLVDDEETIRALGRNMLQALGFKVFVAADGKEAMELFKQHHDEIVCVLLDLTMPRMDGEQAFRELRRIKPKVRVLMSSGYNEQEVTQKFVGKGLAGFIQKPYKLAEVSTKLREVLGCTSPRNAGHEEDGGVRETGKGSESHVTSG